MHGKPDIFNTDQGSQFTGAAFTGMLADNGIAISMDGKGVWRDNVFVERLWRSVKYEEVYQPRPGRRRSGCDGRIAGPLSGRDLQKGRRWRVAQRRNGPHCRQRRGLQWGLGRGGVQQWHLAPHPLGDHRKCRRMGRCVRRSGEQLCRQ